MLSACLILFSDTVALPSHIDVVSVGDRLSVAFENQTHNIEDRSLTTSGKITKMKWGA